MIVELFEPPPPLSFGSGDTAFTLRVRRIDAVARAALVDAAATGSFAEMQRAVLPLVIGWQNVVDMQGHPIPFESMDGDRRVCYLPAFLAVLPFVEQVRVIAAVMAFFGVPGVQVERIVSTISASLGAETDPTPPPVANTTGGASGG